VGQYAAVHPGTHDDHVRGEGRLRQHVEIAQHRVSIESGRGEAGSSDEGGEGSTGRLMTARGATMA
jgi:hypothetical protein